MPSDQSDMIGFRQDIRVEWLPTIFGPFPICLVDTDFDVVKATCRAHIQKIVGSGTHISDLSVTCLSQNSLGSCIYVVDATPDHDITLAEQRLFGVIKHQEQRQMVMRVFLPVDPQLKSLSEVSTMDYLEKFTKIPVVSIFASSHTTDNSLRFEWMLQAFSPGKSVFHAWGQLGHAGRERIIIQLAELEHDLFTRARFAKIGSLYLKNDRLSKYGASAKGEVEESSYEVGKLVTRPFVLKNASIDFPDRGPFLNTAAWLRTQLDKLLLECDRLKQSSDMDDIRMADISRWLAKRLAALVPKFFPPTDTEAEETVLVHENLDLNTIFCDKDGNILCITDWEATACLPLWTAYDLPKLLQGCDLDVAPVPGRYEHGDAGSDVLFQGRLQDYQRAKLKGVYLQTMERIWPDWVMQYNRTENRARCDLRKAMDCCDREMMWQVSYPGSMQLRSWTAGRITPRSI